VLPEQFFVTRYCQRNFLTFAVPPPLSGVIDSIRSKAPPVRYHFQAMRFSYDDFLSKIFNIKGSISSAVIERPTVYVTTSSPSLPIDLLLCTVVTSFAQGLPIGAVPEQWVARSFMASDMVYNICSSGISALLAHDTQGICCKK
jgi:hypothetical protein